MVDQGGPALPVSLLGTGVDWEGGGVLQLLRPRHAPPARLGGGAAGRPGGGPAGGAAGRGPEERRCGARRRLFCPQLSFPHCSVLADSVPS